VFFNLLRVILGYCSSQDEIEYAREVLNCRATLSSASIGMDPLDEKSVQGRVMSNAPRSCARGCVCLRALVFCSDLLDHFVDYL
jgi:hypothetical protein